MNRWFPALVVVGLWAASPIAPERQDVLDRISAQSLKAHVSFLASDLLEGRDTPSRGLEVAAEYIAAQFRRVGLTPAGDDGYFQTANFVVRDQTADGAELIVNDGDKSISAGKNELRIQRAGKAEMSDSPIIKIVAKEPSTYSSLTVEATQGKVVAMSIDRASRKALEALAALDPALVIYASDKSATLPEVNHALQEAGDPSVAKFPILRVHNRKFFKLLENAKPGIMSATISVRLPAPVEKAVKLRNVVGVAPGSDPILKKSYLLVTAHYDHIGRKAGTEGDLIYNGANDDASGVASVIEIADALVHARQKTRRSVVFMTYFGEEEGLYGSRYYGRHPLFPIEDTVADLNLEQLGRTDADGGRQLRTATMTGYGYSEISSLMEAAGAATGIKVYRPEKNSDEYFPRSDNLALANLGVPAHTILVAFDFPDYHKVGDEWEKLDYGNMAQVDRMIALSVVTIADRTEPVRWNPANPKAGKYSRKRQEEPRK